MSKFLPTKGFQSIHPQEFDLNISAIVQMDVFWKLILNIKKELQKLQNDCPVAPKKVQNKKKKKAISASAKDYRFIHYSYSANHYG